MIPSHRPKKLLPIVLLLSLLLLLFACSPQSPQSTFDPHGPIARSQLNLFWIVFWAAVVVFVIVQGALLYTVVRFRRKSRDIRPRQVHGNTPLEIAWTIAPAIVLVIIAIPTILVQFDISREPGPDALNLTVTAHQWWWEFDYPDLDIKTANELHIPVGRDINITLKSNDVIHSFWIPKLAGKLDIVPTRSNKMWLRADTPGEYMGQCAEFCGVAHGWMRFRVMADPPARFHAWVELQKSPAGSPTTHKATKGSTLFLTKGCMACHTIRGTVASGIIGPDLTHFGSRGTLAAGVLDNDSEGFNLTKWLRDPGKIKPGNIMATTAPVYSEPNLAMTNEEIDNLVSYLMSLE